MTFRELAPPPPHRASLLRRSSADTAAPGSRAAPRGSPRTSHPPPFPPGCYAGSLPAPPWWCGPACFSDPPPDCCPHEGGGSEKGIMIPRKVSFCLTAFALQYYLFLLNPASSRYSGCSFKYGSLSPQMV